MNESLRLTALFVRDLLTYDEQLIRIGRQNYDITDLLSDISALIPSVHQEDWQAARSSTAPLSR